MITFLSDFWPLLVAIAIMWTTIGLLAWADWRERCQHRQAVRDALEHLETINRDTLHE